MCEMKILRQLSRASFAGAGTFGFHGDKVRPGDDPLTGVGIRSGIVN